MNSFGICMKKIRKNESLRAMASRIGISPTFLSAMEVGKKSIPIDYADKIRNIYSLDEKTYEELFDSIIETNKCITLETDKMTEEQKKIAMIFARKIDTLPKKTISQIRDMLTKNYDVDYRIKGLSLFANVGIAELFLADCGIEVVVSNELIEKRAKFYSNVYPNCEVICGDITKKEIH